MKESVDIEGATHLKSLWGNRFNGWYLFKSFLRKEHLLLSNGRSYEFDVFDYKYRFIVPSKIKFKNGLITYLNSERNFGIFRFPRDVEGNFISPIYINQKKMRDMLSLTDKEINLILKRKKPVVFEAFRIPQFGFEFIGISNNEINDLGRKFVREFNKKFKEKEGEVKSKIVSKPNYLLILQNILDRQEEDIKKMSLVTDNIVYE